MDKQPNILIVKLSAIGDVVHTLPALNAIRRVFPQARITWLVEEAAAGLLEGHPALDHVMISRRKTWIKGLRAPQRRRHLKEMIAFVHELRRLRYDMVFDFQASIKGAVLIALMRGRRKIGFGRGLEHQELSYLVLNERIPAVSMEIHALDRGLLLLRAVGIPCHDIEYRLPITAEHHRRTDRLLSDQGLAGRGFVAVNPMAQWETKLWDQDKFARAADCVQRQFGLAVVFTGGPEDRLYVRAIQDKMVTASINTAGRTDLLTLAALLQRAEAMITTDTGPMHMAAAVGTPTVALFGPTAPWRTGPYGNMHRVVRAVPSCGPCFKRQCPKGTECMTGIEVAQVLEALADVLR
jgi:heptosyltransferase-1